MNLTTTLLFYLILGTAVSVAVYVTDNDSGYERWFRTFAATLFWPLYLPTVLQRPNDLSMEPAARWKLHSNSLRPSNSADEISRGIGQVEAELDLALNSLEGWSDTVLGREQRRFEELRAAWHTQAQKIYELDQLLEQPAFKTSPATSLAESPGERLEACERARCENIARLRAVRSQLYEDLLNTLARVRELVTMIHLAKYTGAPASRAEELVLQIATAVEGLTEVAGWQVDDHPIAT